MGNQTASGLTVLIKSVLYKIFSWPTIMLGINPSGDPVPIQTDATGNVIVTVPSGGGSVPSGTAYQVAKTTGQTETIPIGAFNVGIIVLTGTATIGGVSWPTNTPYNIPNKLSATLAVVFGSPGTGLINYLS